MNQISDDKLDAIVHGFFSDYRTARESLVDWETHASVCANVGDQLKTGNWRAAIAAALKDEETGENVRS